LDPGLEAIRSAANVLYNPGVRADRSEPDPVVRAYLAGIDRTLLAKNLGLTPEQRLRQLMALQEMAAELMRAGREARGR
jgi:hypothetical protein